MLWPFHGSDPNSPTMRSCSILSLLRRGTGSGAVVENECADQRSLSFAACLDGGLTVVGVGRTSDRCGVRSRLFPKVTRIGLSPRQLACRLVLQQNRSQFVIEPVSQTQLIRQPQVANKIELLLWSSPGYLGQSHETATACYIFGWVCFTPGDGLQKGAPE